MLRKVGVDVRVRYTNHRGETRVRIVRPICFVYGENAYHPQDTWLMVCRDVEKDAMRTFDLTRCDFVNTEE